MGGELEGQKLQDIASAAEYLQNLSQFITRLWQDWNGLLYAYIKRVRYYRGRKYNW